MNVPQPYRFWGQGGKFTILQVYALDRVESGGGLW